MTEAQPWVKWRYDRWRADEGLRMCSLAARGLWADLLAIMHGCKPYGHLAVNGRPPTPKQIASMVGMTTEDEVSTVLVELESNGVFSRSEDGLIFSRRQVRDHKAKETGKTNGLLGGNPQLIKPSKKPVNPKSKRGVKTEKREERRESEKREIHGELPFAEWFETRFWRLYPRKVGRDAALKAAEKALRTATQAAIIAGLQQYQFSPEARYQPHASTWLNAGSWKVEPDTKPPTTDSPGLFPDDWNQF